MILGRHEPDGALGTLPGSIASAVQSLLERHLLDWTGGAVSVHLSDELSFVTPGGAARRLWKISGEDVLRDEGGSDHQHLSPAGFPANYAIHRLSADQLGFPLAIVHTHAGAVYRFSCRHTEGLPLLPPSQPLGPVPLLGQPTEEFEHPSSCKEWTHDLTIPALQSFLNDRGEEIAVHGLAFFDLEHGAYVLGRTLEATMVDLARLEQACRLFELGHLGGLARPGPLR